MKLPKLTPSVARAALLFGLGLLTLIVLIIMVVQPQLADNDLFKMIAQAIIVQGLIGLAAAFYFTDSDGGDPPRY